MGSDVRLSWSDVRVHHGKARSSPSRALVVRLPCRSAGPPRSARRSAHWPERRPRAEAIPRPAAALARTGRGRGERSVRPLGRLRCIAHGESTTTCAASSPSRAVSRSDRDNIDQPVKSLEVLRVARVDRKSRCAGGCRNQEIQCPSATLLASARHFRCGDPPIGASRLSIEGEGIKGRFARCNRPCRRARSSASSVAWGPADAA